MSDELLSKYDVDLAVGLSKYNLHNNSSLITHH